MTGDHRPLRPEWHCDTCGGEWPCAGTRRVITDLYRGEPEELSWHMLQIMTRAADELNPGSPARLYQRFVSWTLKKSAACRVCGRAGHDFMPGVLPRMVPCTAHAIEPIHGAGHLKRVTTYLRDTRR